MKDPGRYTKSWLVTGTTTDEKEFREIITLGHRSEEKDVRLYYSVRMNVKHISSMKKL